MRTNPARGGNFNVRCACGRVTAADMVMDLRDVPAETRAAWGVGETACDACRERVFLRGLATREEFYDALEP